MLAVSMSSPRRGASRSSPDVPPLSSMICFRAASSLAAVDWSMISARCRHTTQAMSVSVHHGCLV